MSNPTPVGGQRTQASGNVLSIIGMVCGVIAIVFIPIAFGPLGLILGGIAKSRGEKLSTVALIVAGVGMVVGFILGAIVFNAQN